MSKEAMKLALEYLEQRELAWNVQIALREALAEQPAQQCRTDGRCQYAIDSGAEGMGHCPKGKCVMPAQCALAADGVCESLDCPNHKPAQRTWVGLTDEEIRRTINDLNPRNSFIVASAIEAKLKEKNT